MSDAYQELTQKVVDNLPIRYARVVIVAVKNYERFKRGHSAKVLIYSAGSNIPHDFSDFLKMVDNESRMITIIKDDIGKQ